MAIYSINEGILFSSQKGREKVAHDVILIQRYIDMYLDIGEKALNKLKQTMNIVIVEPSKFNIKEANKNLDDLKDLTDEFSNKFDEIKDNYVGDVFVNIGREKFFNRADIKKLYKEDPSFASFVKSCRTNGKYYNKIKNIGKLYNDFKKESYTMSKSLYKKGYTEQMSKGQKDTIKIYENFCILFEKLINITHINIISTSSLYKEESYLGNYLNEVIID